MLLFEGLKLLRLRLHNPLQRLYFAEGFSKLTGLTTVELYNHSNDACSSPWPTFSASAFSKSPCFCLVQVLAHTAHFSHRHISNSGSHFVVTTS